MKVCILTHTFPRFKKDVAAPFMDGVADGIRRAGNEVFVLTPFHPRFKRKNKDQKYKIITYKYIFPKSLHKLGYSETLTNDMRLKPLMYILSPFMYFFSVVSLYKLVKKENIDLINAHWILPNGFIASIVSKISGVPVVSTLPGSDVYMAEKNGLFSAMARFAARTSAAVTSNSPQLLDDLARISEKDTKKRREIKEKFSPIIYGVDPKKFKPLKTRKERIRKQFKIGKNHTIVLGVGRLVAKKGFKYLIQAAPNILKKYPNTTFVLIGEGDQRKELEGLAKKLKVFKNFKFPGWVNYKDMVYYMNFADIFILPSVRDEEGNLDDQSVSVVEAMACAKPIITTNFPGYKIVVKDKENGFLVNEKKPKEIERAINKLLSSKPLQQKMGKKSRELIVNHFSWQAIGKQYTRLFSTLIEYYSQGVPVILERKGRIKKAKQIYGVLKEYLKKTDNLNCLDVGCSSGITANYLSKYFKKTVAIDIDKRALEIAQKENKTKNLTFKYMDSEDMTFKNNSFDVVICHQVYNFVNNPTKLMKEIYRVLKPGGACYFSARNKLSLIEPQYKLPLLSLMPPSIGTTYLKLFKKGNKYFGQEYMYLQELKKLVSDFKVHNYTEKILKNPNVFGFKGLQKIAPILKLLPTDSLLPIIPNYIWILEKKN